LKEKEIGLFDAIDLAVDGYDERGTLEKAFGDKIIGINAKTMRKRISSCNGGPHSLSLYIKASYQATRRGMMAVLGFPGPEQRIITSKRHRRQGEGSPRNIPLVVSQSCVGKYDWISKSIIIT
jgi:hypothetical protein